MGNTNRLYCRWFKLPPTIQTVCIVIDNTNRLYCSWLAIQTVCIVVGLQYKLFVLSAPQYKPFVLSSMQYKLFVLQLRATIQTVCIAGGSSYHTCPLMPLSVPSFPTTSFSTSFPTSSLSHFLYLIPPLFSFILRLHSPFTSFRPVDITTHTTSSIVSILIINMLHQKHDTCMNQIKCLIT